MSGETERTDGVDATDGLDATDGADIPADVLDALRAMCLPLPEVVEEAAWAGVRWTIRGRNFAHVVRIADGWPPAYARAAGTAGPCCVLTFRSTGPELEALGAAGHPFFRPVWGTRWTPSVAGVVLDAGPDAAEVAELVTESYRLLAPARLARQVADSPPAPPAEGP